MTALHAGTLRTYSLTVDQGDLQHKAPVAFLTVSSRTGYIQRLP